MVFITKKLLDGPKCFLKFENPPKNLIKTITLQNFPERKDSGQKSDAPKRLEMALVGLSNNPIDNRVIWRPQLDLINQSRNTEIVSKIPRLPAYDLI